MNNKRFYNFMIVLYPDDPNFESQINNLTQYDYIYIKHDNDVTEEGEIKKEHIHFIIRFKNARTITALSKESGVGTHMIEPIKNLTASLKYLIHYKNDNKFQYGIEQCVSNCDLLNRLKKLTHEDIPEDKKIMEIIDFIENFKGEIDLLIFYKYVASIGMWDILRRSATLILKLIEVHNSQFYRDLREIDRTSYNI